MDKRAIGYIRVSTVGGRSGREYHTLEIQRASIERTARDNGYELVDVLTDEDQSGRSRNRPQFGGAMARILAGEADAIIVWKASRFSRNWREAAEDVELLLDNNKDLLPNRGLTRPLPEAGCCCGFCTCAAGWESLTEEGRCATPKSMAPLGGAGKASPAATLAPSGTRPAPATPTPPDRCFGWARHSSQAHPSGVLR